MLCRLEGLTNVSLNSPEKKEHEANDIGVIQLLDNCLKIRELLFDFEVNITSNSLNKLKELANKRPKEMIRFKCFVSSPELQSNQLTGIPKNLIIQTKFI